MKAKVILFLLTQLAPGLGWSAETSWRPAHLEASGLHAVVGSIFTTTHFGVSKAVSMGPVMGISPLYYFTPGNPTFAYDLGIDSNIYVLGGDRYSHSWIINPFSYYSGSHSYRAEQPSFHTGFNLGYRWVFQMGLILSVGAGVKCVYNSLETFSYRPSGRVSEGSVDNFIPLNPSFKVMMGFAI